MNKTEVTMPTYSMHVTLIKIFNKGRIIHEIMDY